MKTISRVSNLTVALISLFLSANLFAQKNDPSSKEIKQIKDVIERETTAFFEIDKQTWSACWAHEPYSFWSFADTTDVNSFSGWEAIHQGFAEYFASSKPSTAKIDRNWLDVKVFGNGAYVRFTQHVRDQDISRGEQAEVRVLEKQNGQWRIVHVGVISSKKPIIVSQQSHQN
jgi:hypothetical protein